MKFVCILRKTAKNCQLWTGRESPAAQDYLAALKYSCVYRERAAGADRGSTIMQRNANGNELEWKTAANEGNDLHCFWHLHCAAGGIGERIANWPNRTAFRMNEWTTRATRTPITANQQRREFASAADPSVALAVRILGYGILCLDSGCGLNRHLPQAARRKLLPGGSGRRNRQHNSQMSAQSLFYVPVDDDDEDERQRRWRWRRGQQDGWQQQSSITVSKLFRNLKTHFHSFYADRPKK